MKYSEVHKDLFTVDDSYCLTHCISSCLAMGAGIALPMQRKFNLRGKVEKSGEDLSHPTCILAGRVFNLITKKKSSGKPTYDSLDLSLRVMREIIDKEGIEKVAMPKIGCGLDRLQWPKVRSIIHDVFQDSSVEILVCCWR